jgi:hypothetical protein
MFCRHSSKRVFSLFLQGVVVLYFHVPPLKKRSHPPSNRRLPTAQLDGTPTVVSFLHNLFTASGDICSATSSFFISDMPSISPSVLKSIMEFLGLQEIIMRS